MTKINKLTLILTLIGITTWGQEAINNFKIEEQKIIWQKVYETTRSFDELTKNIEDSRLFEKVKISDNKVSGNLQSLSADVYGAGYSPTEVPLYIEGSLFTGTLTLVFKDGAFVVTIRKITITVQDSYGPVKKGDQLKLEYLGLDAGYFTIKFKGSSSAVLNYTFSKEFEFKEK